MIKLVKFILFAVHPGQDREELNYQTPETMEMCTNRRINGMENIGNNQAGLHVAVVVTDVQLLATMMYMHQSFAVEDVGNVTREDTPETITILTTKSAIRTSDTMTGPCQAMQDEPGHRRRKRRGGKRKGHNSVQHLHSAQHSQIL